MADTYETYPEFIEKYVIPISQANPSWKQINGRDGEPSRIPVAYFLHQGTKYKVHGDSGIEQLIAPYRAMKERRVTHPLLVGKTRGGNECLVPAPGAGERRRFYVYRA